MKFTEQEYQAYPDGCERHFWMLTRNRLIENALRNQVEIAGDLRAAGTILDVGCGRGISCAYLLERGYGAIGCDPGTPSLITQSLAPYLFLGKEAQDLPPEIREKVRVLLLLDVLEHLEDPSFFLSRLRVLFPNARGIIATVPAHPELWSAYDERYGHYRRYDLTTFAELCQSAGMTLTSQRYIFQSLYLPLRMLKNLGASHRRFSELPKTDSLRRWIHQSIAHYFTTEARLCPGSIPGTSIFAQFNF